MGVGINIITLSVTIFVIFHIGNAKTNVSKPQLNGSPEMGIGIYIITLSVAIPVIFHIGNAQKCIKTPIKRVSGGNDVCEYTENKRTGPIEVRIGAEFVTINCQICTCSKTGLECCEGSRPPKEIPIGCKIIKEKCEHFVVKKSNPSKDCFTGASIYSSQNDIGGTVQRFIHSPEGTALMGLVKKGMNYFQRQMSKPRWMSGNRSSRRRNSESMTEPSEMDHDMILNMLMMEQMAGGTGQLGAASSLGLMPNSQFSSGRSLLSEGMGILGSILNKVVNGGTAQSDILSSGNTGNPVGKSSVSANTGMTDFVPTTTPSSLLDFSGTGTGLFPNSLDFTGHGISAASNPNSLSYMTSDPFLWFK